ncbi:hypothetical protein SME36J_51180 (plasmid) [Serratia marcescens]|nr:hypothetical protein SME36J_51180 [Serratia marcescens]
MTYIFLIIVVSSQSMSMQVQPMQDIAQCKAAIKAIDIVSENSACSALPFLFTTVVLVVCLYHVFSEFSAHTWRAQR